MGIFNACRPKYIAPLYKPAGGLTLRLLVFSNLANFPEIKAYFPVPGTLS